MKRLTKTELAHLHATEETMGARAVEHARRRGELLRAAALLSAQVAASDPAAIEESQRLRAEADKAKLEEDACRAEQAKALEAIDADKPFRDADDAAQRKKAREDACRAVHASARECDEAAKALAGWLSDFQGRLQEAVATGVDPHVQHQMLLQYVFEPMLVAAGFGRVRTEWAMIAPRSLEAAAREQVRA